MKTALRSSRTYVARTRYKLQNYLPTYLPTLTTRTGAGRTTYLPTLPPHRDAGKTPTYLPTSYVRCFLDLLYKIASSTLYDGVLASGVSIADIAPVGGLARTHGIGVHPQ